MVGLRRAAAAPLQSHTVLPAPVPPPPRSSSSDVCGLGSPSAEAAPAKQGWDLPLLVAALL